MVTPTEASEEDMEVDVEIYNGLLLLTEQYNECEGWANCLL